MSEQDVQELAETIYNKCGVQIRYCDCFVIAQKLIEMGWKKNFNDESQKEI